MDKQKVFDFVFKNILAQGGPSTDGNGLCKYRGENGTKCAIGWLIPDSAYRTEMESRGVASYWVINTVAQNPLIGHIRDIGDLTFLRALQSAHDVASSPDRLRTFLEIYESEMKAVARGYGLEFRMPAAEELADVQEEQEASHVG